MTLAQFGERLRELREGRGWTRGELAKRAGVSERAVAQWELAQRGPSFLNAVSVADALGVSTEAFRVPPKAVPFKRGRGRPKKPPAD